MRFFWVLALCAGVCAGQNSTVEGTGSGSGYAAEGSAAGSGETAIGGVLPCAPPNYCAYTGTDIRAWPTVPNMGTLVKNGTIWTDTSLPSSSPSPVIRCTDANSAPNHLNDSFSAGQGGAGNAQYQFNADDSLLHVNGSFGYIMQFNAATLSCASTVITADKNQTSPGSSSTAFAFGTGQFDPTNPSVFYAQSSGHTSQIIPYTINTSTGTFTVGSPIADFQFGAFNGIVSEWQSGHAYSTGDYVKHTLSGAEAPDWTASNSYTTLGTLIQPTSNNPLNCAFKLTTVGVSGTSSPTWSSGTACPYSTDNTISDGTAKWKSIGGPAVFLFQLTSAGGTSGSSTPLFVTSTGRPDLLTTASDNGLTWTNVGPNVMPDWEAYGGISHDSDRFCEGFSTNQYGYNNSYTGFGGQGTGIFASCYSISQNLFKTINTATFIQSTIACSGGTGPECAGGNWVISTDGVSTNNGCGFFIHNIRNSWSNDYPGISEQGAEFGQSCPQTGSEEWAWQPFHTFSASGVMNKWRGGENHGGIGNTHAFNIGQACLDNSIGGSGCPAGIYGFSTGVYSVTVDLNNPYAILPAINWQATCASPWSPNNPRPPCTFGSGYDSHLVMAYNPAGADTGPYCGTIFYSALAPPPVAPWQGEFICVSSTPRWTNPASPNGGQKVWRFNHTFCSGGGTTFDAQFCISQVSSTGKFAAFTSDWNCSLGTSSGGTSSLCGRPWIAGTAYSLNQLINPFSANGGGGTNFGIWKVTTPGTAASSAPSWVVCNSGNVGATVTDANGVVYTCQGTGNGRADVFIVKLASLNGVAVVPATFFGLHWKITNPYPTMPFGSLRLWDSGTRWQQMQTGASTYVFTTTIDPILQAAKTNGQNDVLLTLSATPNFISSDPSDSSCDYHTTANGSCGVPTDIAASCTNVNGLNNCDGKTDGTNQTWRNFIYNLGTHIAGLSGSTYQKVTAFEIWNEFTQSGGTSWEGTNAQMVRMVQDANCILTGRGVITSQDNAACNAGNMGVAAVNVLPGVTVTTPDSVMTAPESTSWGTYLATAGALDPDIAAVHAYTQGGTCCAQPETVQDRYNTASTKLSAAGGARPIWSTEGGYGQQSPSEPDLDLQAAFVARYYLLGWSSGFKRMYWYAWDNPSWGTLWNPNGVNSCNDGGSGLGCLTKAGTSYGQTYNWMVGSSLSACGVLSGTVWSCALLRAGVSHLVLWDTAQTCSGGVCTTANQTVSPTWTVYQDMTSVSSPIPIVSNLVPVGAKPVILSQ